ncbi:hypothetical protein [Apilactobacillus timberlakei]|uniref:hypothetical protein n=1 Tax=Apilactobacillus timberlakei TaxID=2008380 RepID=UPI0015E85FE4|nr:hypothetical protein [Apilactobacillus timberlakei]TPR13194.1 hypothetical protein DYZ97_04725 [Apilactobacillus timberlakei]
MFLICLFLIVYFAILTKHQKNKNLNNVSINKKITYKDLIYDKYDGQNYYLKNVYVNQQFTKDNIKQATVSDDKNRLYFIILNKNKLSNVKFSYFCKIEKHKILKTNLGYRYRYPVLKLINKKTAD